MASFNSEVFRDVGQDSTTFAPVGRLGEDHADAFRSVLDVCIRECPTIVIVDMSRCDNAWPGWRGTCLDAVARQDTNSPTVAVLTCGVESVEPSIPDVVSFADCEQARAAAAQVREQHTKARLAFEAVASAPSAARRHVQAACELWSMPDVADEAALIVSELVSNCVIHTSRPGVLTVTARDPFLHIQVEDTSAVPPVRDASGDQLPTRIGGRGLAMVHTLASAWGYRIDHRGASKVVWSSLRSQAGRLATI